MRRATSLAGASGLLLAVVAVELYLSSGQVTGAAGVAALGAAALLGYAGVQYARRSRTEAAARQLRYGGNAVVLVVAVAGIAVMLNYLADRHRVRYDLTASGQYSLTSQTKSVLAGLTEDVQVTAFFQEGSAEGKMVRDLLDEYRFTSDRVKVRFVDPDRQPSVAREYGITSYGTSVVESGGERRQVYLYDLFGYDWASGGAQNFQGEQAFTRAILDLTRKEQRVAYVVQGHGEPDLNSDLSLAREYLEAEGYTVKALNIAQEGGVPGDATLVIVAGPKREIPPRELEALDAYLTAGGRAAVLVGPPLERLRAGPAGAAATATATARPSAGETAGAAQGAGGGAGGGAGSGTGDGTSGGAAGAGAGSSAAAGTIDSLEALLAKWGVQPATDVVVEPARNYFGDPLSPIPVIESHEVTRQLIEERLGVVLPNSRSLEAGEDEGVVPLLTTSDQAWGETDLSGDTARKGDDDRLGPLTLAVAVARTVQAQAAVAAGEAGAAGEAEEGTEAAAATGAAGTPATAGTQGGTGTAEAAGASGSEASEARLLVIGSDAFLHRDVLGFQGNVDFLVNAVNWLAGREEDISIRPKELDVRTVFLTGSEANLIFYTTVVVIPLLVLAIGGGVWWRRRHL